MGDLASLAGLVVVDLLILVHSQEEMEMHHQHHLHKEIRVVLEMDLVEILGKVVAAEVLVDQDLEVE
jgi:hypothetical protein